MRTDRRSAGTDSAGCEAGGASRLQSEPIELLSHMAVGTAPPGWRNSSTGRASSLVADVMLST